MIVKHDKEIIQNYLSDASNIKGNADVVYIPEHKDEINSILKNCYDNSMPVTISAGGTGTTGSRVPLSGAILSVEKLNRIISFDSENKTVTVEPGVVVKDLQEYLSERGFLYPPNPTETNSMVGGNVATNASGARTFKYGSTRDFIEELEVVLADGDEIHLKRGEKSSASNSFIFNTISGSIVNIPFENITIPDTTKNAAGYFIRENMDLIDLFIGSEGTLGVVKKIKLKLIPKPENELGIVIFFKDEMRLLDFVEIARKRSKSDKDILSARLIEYFDNSSLAMQRQINSEIPDEAKSAIWIEQEFIPRDEEAILAAWYDLIMKYSDMPDDIWIALNENEKRKLYEFRHALQLRVDDLIAKMDISKISLDTCVSNSIYKDYILQYDNMLQKSGVKHCKWGHIGDSHLHTNLFPVSEQEHNAALQVYSDIIDMTIEKNGTISAEHGIGKIKKDYLIKMYGTDTINYFRKIKKAFDPKGILNQHNMFEQFHTS